jgi:hypothetical protein
MERQDENQKTFQSKMLTSHSGELKINFKAKIDKSIRDAQA